MDIVNLHLEQLEDESLSVLARRGAREWRHVLPAENWQALAREWGEQFESDMRPLNNPAALENLGLTLSQECFGPFFSEMLAGDAGGQTGGQIVLSANRDECLNLPWELLPVGVDFLGTCPAWTLRRTTQNAGTLGAGTLGPGPTPLRVLFMSSAPLNEVRLDFEKEEEAILRLTTRMTGNLHLHIAESGTFEELRQTISELQPHVVHLSGHGIVHQGLGHFAFEDERGGTDLRNCHDMGRLLFAGSSVRLVFVNACQSSQAAAAGLCQTLVRDGRVPLALGWAASIADDLATNFAQQFYHELAAGKGVDAAIATARRQVQHLGQYQKGTEIWQDASFALPQLYAASSLDELVDRSRLEQPAKPGVRYALLGDEVRGLREGFVGRRRELQKTRANLRDGDATVLLLTGIGGAGKSTLATRLANRFEGDGFKVVALKARDEELLGFGLRLVTEVADACYELNLERYEKTLRDGERPLADRLRLLVRVLNEAKILLVLDNLESLLNEPPAAPGWKDETIGGFFAALVANLTGQGRAILTCRYLPENFDPKEQQLLQHLALTDFTAADFFKYLNRHEAVSRRIANGELPRELLDTLFRKLGATPRFLEQACALLQTIAADQLGEQLESIHLEGVEPSELATLQQEYFAKLFLPRLIAGLTAPSRQALSRLALLEPPLPLDGVARVTGLDEVGAQYCIADWLKFGLVQPFHEKGELTLYAIYPLQRSYLATPELLAPETALATHAAAAAFFQSTFEKDRESELGLEIEEELSACLQHATAAGDAERQRWAVVRLSDRLRRRSEFRAALELTEVLLLDASHPELLLASANALESLGDWKKARKYYERALADHQVQDALGAALLHNLATIDRNEGKYASARTNFGKSLEILQVIGDRADESASRHQLATIDMLEGKYAAARINTEKSLEIKQVIGDRTGEAASWYQLASIDLNEGKYASARKNTEKSLEIKQDIGDRAGEAASRHQLASIDVLESKYKSARINTEKSLEILQDIGNRAGEALSWHQLASIDRIEGKYTAARTNTEKSLEILRDIGNRAGEAGSWHQLASIDVHEGKYAAARKNTEKSLEIDQAIGNRAGESASWHQLASIDLHEGKYVSARTSFGKSLEILQAIGDRAGEAASWHQLAMIELKEGKYTAARKNLGKSLVIRQTIGDRAGEAMTLAQIGVIAWEKQRREIGIRLLAMGFGILAEIGASEQDQVGKNLAFAAGELGLNQAGVEGILVEAAQAYQRDRGAEWVRLAFEGL